MIFELVYDEKPIKTYPSFSDYVLFSIGIFKHSQAIGQLLFYPSTNYLNIAIVDIFIKEEYRSKWLFKEFAKQLDDKVVNTCRDYGVNMLTTYINNPKSIRILEFFQFQEYNENKYYRRLF